VDLLQQLKNHCYGALGKFGYIKNNENALKQVIHFHWQITEKVGS
jgi:hypothetical protein